MLEEEDRLKELEDRERAMRQLESDITDVNTIFKVRSHLPVRILPWDCTQDLATMVHEQGEVIDSIESNIESTTVQVSSGTEQLRQVRQEERIDPG